MRYRLLQILSCLFVLTVAAQAHGGGYLEGSVYRQPPAYGTVPGPPMRWSPPRQRPAAHVRVLVFDQRGTEVANPLTDNDGHFALELPAGIYSVRCSGFDAEEGVQVSEGRTTRIGVTRIPLPVP